MTSQQTERTDSPRLLRRRTAERVLGGVAGGLGDYVNVDPLLIRIGFVGLMIFGGAGLVLYVVAWLLIPAEGQDASSIEGFLRRLGLTPVRIAWILLAVVAIILISNMPIGGPLDGSGTVFYGPLPGLNPAALWALAVIVTGIVLLRRRETATSAISVPAASTFTARSAPRPRSPLAWYVCASVLLGIGLLALASQLAGREVAPGQFFGVALVVLGIGLMIGTWWGHAKVMILLALLLAPIGVTASFVTAPLEGGVGDLRFAPANAAELRTEYRLLSGRMTLDLTDLSIGAQPTHIAASVALGQLVVIVPEGASVEVHTRVGAGDAQVFGSSDAGTSLEGMYVRRHQFGTIYILDLQAGIGEVLVETGGGS